MMVILDNGHGHTTPGKRSPVWTDGTQLFEWEFARDVVKRIHKGLQRLSIESVILVPEAADVRLTTRVNRANQINADHPGSFFISVHGNAGGGQGWEVFLYTDKTESKALAQMMFNSAVKHLPEFRMRKGAYTDYKFGDFTVLKGTNCPAILTENLFYDNEKECKFMLSDEGHERIAKLHVEGILNFIQYNYEKDYF